MKFDEAEDEWIARSEVEGEVLRSEWLAGWMVKRKDERINVT